MSEEFLYKYRSVNADSFDRDLEALQNNYFWASDLEHLNDDQECLLNPNKIYGFLEKLKILHPNCSQSIDNVRLQLDNYLASTKNIGVFSLSRNPHIPQMWASYASERKGYCVIYRGDKLLTNVDGIIKGYRYRLEVAYKSAIPELQIYDFKNMQVMLEKLVATKEQRWRYEEETRIVADFSGHQNIVPTALYGIIFGSQMSEDDKQKIKNALSERSIKFYQLRKKEDDYGYEHYLVDENIVSSSLKDDSYEFINKVMPVIDNFYVKLNFAPSSQDELKNFMVEFKQKHTERQCNIYVHDQDVDMEMFEDDIENYDYLRGHLLAEWYFDCDEILFNKEKLKK